LRATPAPALPDVSPETSTQLRGDLMVCRLELNALARLCQRQMSAPGQRHVSKFGGIGSG